MRHCIYILMCVCLLASCSSRDGKKSVVKGKVQSAPYELLVVADKEWLKTEMGQQLVEVVEAPISGLPQREGNFRVTYINPEAFKGTFQYYANILTVNVDKKNNEPVFGVVQDKYARPQVVVHLLAPDYKSLVELVQRESQQLLDIFNENEFARERALLEKHHSGVVTKKTQKMFGVSVNVPVEIDDMKDGENFLWASASKQDFKQNVCLYTIPMEDLTEERWTEVRDSVMKVNIPGERDDQWMETDFRTVSVRSMKVGDKDILTMRGLWDMRNDAMGGPFVCYAYPDIVRDRLLIVEGFVFAPDKKKRPIVRQLEAALQTVFFVPGTHK